MVFLFLYDIIMQMKTLKRFKFRPIHVLPLSFAVMIAIGTALLMLPVSSVDKSGLSLTSALFTATSASCVTGLVVADTGTYFSTFGQVVILILIQLGGLGFMTAASILFVLIGRRISLRERLVLAEAFGENRLQGIVRLAVSAVAVTFACELTGAALLSLRFIPQYGLGRGIYYGIFHAVSAFCNAGFDLLGGYRSFTAYAGDPLVCGVLMALVVIGSLGFTVILDAARCKRFAKLHLHSKIVFVSTILLLLGGAALIMLFEYRNPATLKNLPFGSKLLAALFQSVTFRTAGFNTIDQYALRDATKILGCALMLAGGAPAGTAGGLKITTLAVLFCTVRSQLHGRRDTEMFHRRVPADVVRRSLCIVVIGFLLFICGVIGVSFIEDAAAGGQLGFLNQAYEVISALCTVGLSVGLTGAARVGTRLLLIILMFSGRVGMLTMALSMTSQKDEGGIRLPEEDVLVG